MRTASKTSSAPSDAVRSRHDGKTCPRFLEKPAGPRAIRIRQIALLPPILDALTRIVQQRTRWADDRAFGAGSPYAVDGSEIPQVVAGPCRPREAVVDVEPILGQPRARPCAMKRLARFDHRDRSPDVLRQRSARATTTASRGRRARTRYFPALRPCVALHHSNPLGDDCRFDPCIESRQSTPEMDRDEQLSKAPQIVLVEDQRCRRASCAAPATACMT